VDRARLRKLLEDVKRGRTGVDEATRALADLPFAELGYATVDTHRSVRFGFPEVVYGEGKSPEHLLGIVDVLVRRKQPVLVTRLDEEKAAPLLARWPKARWHPEARILHLPQGRPRAGRVAVTCAGTSDLPVAEEAALTAEAMGATVARIYDVGVAGLHRLLRRRSEIQEAHVAVAVAGMEGALASVVGGLVGIPVVAVPTSVGYGANFHGLSALLTMLNSCAPNVAVVNIDNGFGAGFYAALVSRSATRAGRAR
jgi:pyridinium-3,5-biscarboxylic acid mononucleotide synthase